MRTKILHAIIALLFLGSMAKAQEQNASLTGVVTYGNSINAPMANVKVYLEDTSGIVLDSVNTAWNGTFTFNLSEGYYRLRADLNIPWIFGASNSVDALLVMKHFVGLDSLQGINLRASDVNNSHATNATDALMIAQRFAGIINSFLLGDWVEEEPGIIYVTGGMINYVQIQLLLVGDVNGSYQPPVVPCTPQPDLAQAGPDQMNVMDTSVQLNANHPANGQGQWSLISGNGGYFYDISNPSTTFTGLLNHSYVLVWTISTICGSNSDTVEVIFGCGFVPVVANAGYDRIICAGDCVVLEASGGNTYVWSNQAATASIQVCPTITTKYTVTVGDGQGCTATDQVTVTVQPLPQANAGSDQEICLGACANLQAIGGTAYLWSNQATTASTQVCPTASTTYTVTVSDANGCTATDLVTVTVHPLPQANAGSDQEICLRACANLQASGGTNYLWSNQANTAATQVCPTTSTTYNVTVSDANGCSATDDVTVTVHPLPQANAGSDQEICLGACANLQAIGGTAYLWSNQATTASTQVCPTASTTYTVTVSDANGCTATDQVTVTVHPLPQANAGSDQEICLGACANLQASGGTTFLWSNQATTAAIQVCPTSSTTYTVTVSDANGCSATDDVTVTLHPLPQANAGADQEICLGACANLQASGGIAYLWSNQATTAAIQVCPTQNTTYTVTVSDANGCAATDDVTVTVHPLPQADAGPDSLSVQDTSIVLQANQSVNGTGMWSILSGTGGSFDDATVYNTVFTGNAGNFYALIWTITEVCGSSSDTVVIGFTAPDFICGDTLTDTRDGQQYPTVQIGTQCWMAKNLNLGTMVSSTISGSSHSDVSNDGIIEKYCHDNVLANCGIYGGLYDWDEVMNYTTTLTNQGICSPGWHIPSDADWCTLTTFVDPTVNCFNLGWSGTHIGGMMKEVSFNHWLSPNTDATNSSGFMALGSGSRDMTGTFYNLKYDARYWSSSVNISTEGTRALGRVLFYENSHVYRGAYSAKAGFSVRCLRDNLYPCSPQPNHADAGKDTLEIPNTSITLQANQPINAKGAWTILSGLGGSLFDSTQYNTVFTGVPGTTYILKWSISNQCSSSNDTVIIGFSSSIFSCGDTIADIRDNQQYPTVQIGTQCWMARNLNVGMMIPSTITGNSHSDLGNNGVIEKYCLNNDVINCDIYGGLYDWNEVMNYISPANTQGICPEGWHIPTDAEWCGMTSFLDTTVNCNTWGWNGTTAGGMLKDWVYSFWNSPNIGATNASGFSAFGAGYRDSLGSFSSHLSYAGFWSSSENSSSYGVNRSLYYNRGDIYRGYYRKTYGFSVRCIENVVLPCGPQPDQAFAGQDNLKIPGTSIALQANQPLNGSGFWSILSGTGGSFADSTLHNTLFSGLAGNFYALLWTIKNPCGSKCDTVFVSFSSSEVFSCGNILTDARDGQQYPTVQIGTQCWMAKNLNIGIMVNSNNTAYTHSDVSNNDIIEKYCYDNVVSNCNIYGGLYDWNEMLEYLPSHGVPGICPPGWHVPTETEWCLLTTFLDPTVNCTTWDWTGTNAGGIIKHTGSDYWTSPNDGATNSSGFSARGAGGRISSGIFYYFKNRAFFWTSSEYSKTDGVYWGLINQYSGVGRIGATKSAGYSVRCLLDYQNTCAPQPDQANAGPDSLNIPSTSITLQANQPSIGTGLWTILSGTGGSFADSSVHNTFFTVQLGNTYILIWTISNPCGSTRDTVNIGFTASQTFSCGTSFTDTRDGQQYPTVQIGTQCWMAKNLNIGTMVSGSNNQTNNSTIDKYCYNNDASNCTIYGGLYQWNEMMGYTTTPGTQGICPTGWHIPTDAEWCILTTFLDTTVNCNTWGGIGTNAGGKMKATGFDHWFSPNTGAANSSGFTALGAGYRANSGSFYYLRDTAYFWSSSEFSSTDGIRRYLYYDYAGVYRYSGHKTTGFSVRCLRN